MHSHYDLPGWPGVIMNLLLGGIILGYVVIAIQFYTMIGQDAATRNTVTGWDRESDHKARRALKQLVSIFVFCAICGYLPRMVHFPEWLFLGCHTILFAATWSYLFTRQTALVSVALNSLPGKP